MSHPGMGQCSREDLEFAESSKISENFWSSRKLPRFPKIKWGTLLPPQLVEHQTTIFELDFECPQRAVNGVQLGVNAALED